MTQIWQIETRGNPLQVVQQFLMDAWALLGLDAILLPMPDPDTNTWQPQVITSPTSLSTANPFTPIMVENLALHIKPFLNQHDEGCLAVLLRPCELRAWKTLRQETSRSSSRLITISTDCLGAYPLSEFGWRAKRKGSDQELTSELLQFSPQGGISPFRLRTACQLCTDPAAGEADINIHILGLPIREHILITTSPAMIELLGGTSALQPADQNLVAKHLNTSSKLFDRNQATRQRLIRALTHDLNLDLESLVHQLNTCEDCQSCMLGCPICANLGLKPGKPLTREEVAEWMIACVGCGMCEEHCPTHKPLVEIFAVIQDQIKKLV